jgi:transcription initiation factor TFIIIB Brf1 subunit/transcription initiation factor TFIIB
MAQFMDEAPNNQE